MAERGRNLVITGIGMRCGVGQNVLQSAASVRAGITRFSEWDYFDAALIEGEGPVLASPLIPDLRDRNWIDKFPEIATQPFWEALWSANLDIFADAVDRFLWGAYVAIPRLDRPGVESEDADFLKAEVEERFLLPALPTKLETFARDHAGGLLALEKACRDLSAGEIGAAVVGGVDSLLHSPYLAWLWSEGKLKSEINPAGLIPGEGAAFIVVETQEFAQTHNATPLAEITPVHVGKESTPAGKPSNAEVFSQVVQKAMQDAPCPPNEIFRVATDLNGERWRFLEWGLTRTRIAAGMPHYWEFWHPADCYGDIGAASAPALICIATQAFRRGYAVGKSIPVCVSSDSGERAAICVSSLTK